MYSLRETLHTIYSVIGFTDDGMGGGQVKNLFYNVISVSKLLSKWILSPHFLTTSSLHLHIHINKIRVHIIICVTCIWV